MGTNTHNNYLFKALDAYPYNLEETMEALNYALSYHPESTEALYLKAQVYAFQLYDYEAAKECFEAVLGIKIDMPKVYPDYLYVLINNEDYEAAQKLLEFALTVKATDKAVLRLLQGQLMERRNLLKPSLAAYKLARKKGGNTRFVNFVNDEITRVKNKISSKNKKKKKKKKSKKKGVKKNRSNKK